MKSNTKIAVLFFLVTAGIYCVWKPYLNDGPDSSHMLVSKTAQTPARTVSILFVGNSYTFVNDMPAMLVHIASSDPANTTVVQVESVTRGGVRLLELWKAGLVEPYLSSGHWDYVVLQEQSEWAMLPGSIGTTSQGVAKLADEIRNAGAMPLLYETWQREPGSRWYTDPQTAYFHNARYMEQMIHYQTLKLASKQKIGVVPVGPAWEALLDMKPGFPLYMADGSHPSLTGTYLVAMMFYHELIKKDVTTAEFIPTGIDPANAAYIRNFVTAYTSAR